MTNADRIEADGNRSAWLREQEAKALRAAITKIANRETKRRKAAQRPGPVLVHKKG